MSVNESDQTKMSVDIQNCLSTVNIC